MTLFTHHVIKQLSAYHHAELSAGPRIRVENHLRECTRCRAAYDEIRLGASLLSLLSISSAPESIWQEINRPSGVLRSSPRMAVWAVTACVTLAFAAGVFFQNQLHKVPSWEVAIRGRVRIGNSKPLENGGTLRTGEVLQTDETSEAQVKIANIGELTVDRNTRIRLLVTRSDQHRIALDRGKVEARTWAPPRLFVVDTPSATAIDLGCMYTLEVEEDGSSLLHVTLGLVALERDKRETVVPAGAFCRTRPGAGPGTPFFEGASRPFQSALDYLDSNGAGTDRSQQLDVLLRESRLRDGLTLWHLIPRIDARYRGRVYDRLAEFIPPPAGVTRDGIIALDSNMLAAWQPLVAQLWQ